MGNHHSVKLIGLGGVGSIVARYAGVFLASLSQEIRLVLVDGDAFEHSNASRMLFADCGNKAAVLRREMLPRFAESTLSLVAIEEFLTPGNVSRLIQAGDICLLCVDNHATRKLVNDYCATLPDICLISGGNDGVGPDSSGAGAARHLWQRPNLRPPGKCGCDGAADPAPSGNRAARRPAAFRPKLH